MLTINDAAQLTMISGGPAGGGVGGYSPGMIGWEGERMAVVTIGPPTVEMSANHTFLDGALGGSVGRYVGVAATAFTEPFLVAIRVSTGVAGPAAIVVGAVVGVGAMASAMVILRREDKRRTHGRTSEP